MQNDPYPALAAARDFGQLPARVRGGRGHLSSGGDAQGGCGDGGRKSDAGKVEHFLYDIQTPVFLIAFIF